MPASVLLLTTLLWAALSLAGCELNLVVLHNNDVHGRFEETEGNSGNCRPENRNRTCVGGFARTAHEVRRYRREAAEGRGPEVVFLNAGDTYVGTVWFGLFRWEISQRFWNVLEPDAMCLGNHEFDEGPSGLAPFVEAVKFPIVAANLDLTNEPSLMPYVNKSTILERAGHKIGIIGVVTTQTPLISKPGNVNFLDEVESVIAESERLDAMGVKIIIVLSHSGYLKDQEIAKRAPLVDAIVGGHSHTFLWSGCQPDSEPAEGPYPTVVTQDSGKRVPVVQAYAYAKYLGILNLTFDDHGEITDFSGQPELLVTSIPQDGDLLELLESYRPRVEELNTEVVGRSKVKLDGYHKTCRRQECNLGNLLTDALVAYKASVSPSSWTDAPVGLYNGGDIRSSVARYDVTRGDLLTVVPFGNQVVTVKLNGSDLVETLEIGVRGNGETNRGEFLQVSGLQVVYDLSRPVMSRVVSVKVRCGSCAVPVYEEVSPSGVYAIVTISYLADGGDGHYVLRERGFDRVVEDLGDIDNVVWYFQNHNPVFPEVEGRIRFDC